MSNTSSASNSPSTHSATPSERSASPDRAARHLEIVQSIYAAFGRGDVPHILESLDPDIEWEYGFAPNQVPWLAHRRGREGVASFFAALSQGLELHHFAVRELLPGKDKVVALVEIGGKTKPGSTSVAETDEVHIWHFNDADRVHRFRHVLDTLQHDRAWRGV